MNTTAHTPLNGKARTLIFSLRNILGNDLFRCPHFEFEDTIRQLDGADIVAPRGNVQSQRNRMAKRLACHGPMLLKSEIEKVQVKRSYDLFFAICGFSLDLLLLDSARPLMDACAMKICLIDELWIKEMNARRHFLEVLKRFDLVVMYYSQSVEPLSRQLGVRCAFLPPGIDSMLFCPLPNAPARVIDVYSIGRRSEKTHAALLKMAENQNMFYLYDSIAGNQAINSREHRRQYANLAKRSRYFIVNPGLIDRPETRGNQLEIGNRYFEGAAAGTIMVGERPDTALFEQMFSWPDALIHVPYNSETIADLINDLDRQPERLELARQTNINQVLNHHDWAYRWEAILRLASVEGTAALDEKKERLQLLSDEIACSH